ncbi:MAG TPA: T9SS type A sorting domain-containing protein [Anditalea sp.]|nr:T9SS type A sorting domain-containing protein [Anditalea sp.]
MKNLISGPVNLTGNTLTYRTPDNPNLQVTISLRMRNSCGWSAWRSASIWARSQEEDPWLIYPNPSSDDVISVQQGSDEFKTSGVTAEFDLILYSEDGREVLTKRKNKGRKVTILVAHLKKGDYYLRIIQEETIIRKKVRIQ